MKEIYITQRNGKEHIVMVDDADYDEVIKHKWRASKAKHTYYIKRDTYTNGKQKTIYLHRVLLGINDSKMQVDHKDRNGLNNQRENLRVATSQQNHYNGIKIKARKGVPTSSQYKGVCWVKRDNKWYSTIYLNRKCKYLGYYDDEYDAHIAYDKAAKSMHKDFYLSP